MKNKLFLLLLSISLSVFLISCGTSEKHNSSLNNKKEDILLDEEKKDTTIISSEEDSSIDIEKQDLLLKYLNEDLYNVVVYENIVSTTYDSVSVNNYTDDYTMYTALIDTIITNSLQLINEAEAIECGFDELREVHELYIKAMNIQHQAFTIIVVAIENQDSSKISEANELLYEARKYYRDYLSELESLCTANDVILQQQ